MKLSKRLSVLASFVNKGDVVADIGCDHAQLCCALVKSGQVDKAYACDIAQGPLMQLFKVASVEISTAGSNYTIDGLTEADAKEMITYLEEYLEKRIEELKNEALL